MSGLPEWIGTLSGFDPAGWWLPIVCTHGDRGAPLAEADVLGVMFERSDGSGLHWSGGVVLSERDVGIADTRLWRREDTNESEALEIEALHGKGSMYIRCSRGCTPRIPYADWDQIIQETRHADIVCLDVIR